MKKTLSLILAALILASAMTSCGNTGSKETTAETNAAETVASETEAPTDSAYDTTKITENCVAKAHIVLAANASDQEKSAAEELAYHIKLVSGADVTVSDTVQEESLPIIIGTPATVPELEELFPEDLAWLRTTYEEWDNEVGFRRWGDDGFAIRQKDGKIYIFGANAYGALNGVYDFIEENLDLIWVTSTEEGIIYDEMPTIEVTAVDYREKSPFQFRWAGASSTLLFTRNKHNTITPAGGGHNVTYLVTSSPLYDPNETEYWETNVNGEPLDASTSRQVNYWSELTAEVIAAKVIADLDKYDDANRPQYYSVSQMDHGFVSGVYPDQNLPFEYAPGQFVDPTDLSYKSTVLCTFINRVARKVAEKYPDVIINTFAYGWSTKAPVCEPDDNVSIWFCPYHEDMSQEHFSVALAEWEAGYAMSDAIEEALYYEEWVDKHDKIMIFDYYFCHFVRGWYERPIWYRLQNDYIYYADRGLLGFFSDGTTNDQSDAYLYFTKAGSSPNPSAYTYRQTQKDASAMNLMAYWLYFKLCWNPYEDVDALIAEFCEKVYGDAAPYMMEYYDLIQYGWNYGSTEILPYEFNMKLTINRDARYYYDYFLDMNTEDGTYLLDAIRDALNNAWAVADDKTKELIRRPYEVFEDWTRFLE